MAISFAVAVLCAFWSVSAISLSPPGVKPRQMTIGAAATHVMLDSPRSMIGDAEAIWTEYPGFVKRATLFGSLMGSAPVRERIGERIGVPGDRIAAISRLTSGVDRTMREPDTEQRANQLLLAKERYRLEIQADPEEPVVHVYAQAPSAGAAVELANASVEALKGYLRDEAGDAGDQIVVTQLGPARGGVVDAQTRPLTLLLTFVVAFGLALAALLGVREIRRGWLAAAHPPAAAAPAEWTPAPASEPPVRVPAPRRRSSLSPLETMRTLVSTEGDWPRTTRLMPWLIAAFMVILWLVPFNVIELTASLPFDLKFDRLVLPLVFATWLLALATGGTAAPRVRITPIHVGVGGLIAVACIGIVLGARELNQTLEFELPVKKLTLLLSYGLLFVLVASSVRRTEVPAFLKYSLVLAVICALGMIWEYRFRYNAFYDLWDKLLPGIFRVGQVDPNQVDDIGRRMTRGPAEHPLEVVAMLSLALPIALVGIMNSRERRARLLYGLAACILLAAAISTYRKSALLAPVSVVLTIAYFRRGELLRLAPLAAVSVVLIHALSPGALGSILFQFHPERLGVATVSDRSADYDAIRPDLWTHLAFGRGYGSYDHVSYRILDSEILSRLVDTGILGLLALVLMVASIVFAARRPIRSRVVGEASAGLAVAAAAVAFLVLAFLFDVTSFPHTPYILLSLAGLLAVVAKPEESWPPPPPAERKVDDRPAVVTPARRTTRGPVPEGAVSR
jgi:hypothetical protein